MSDSPDASYVIPTLDDLPSLLAQRDEAAAMEKLGERVKKEITVKLRDAIASQGFDTYRTDTHSMKMQYPGDDETIDKELLLLYGVDPEIIKKATKRTPITPWLRIDKLGARAKKEG